MTSDSKKRTRWTTETFKARVKEVNKHNLDLSEAEYITNVTPVKVTCLDCQTVFYTKPAYLINGTGCLKCRLRKLADQGLKKLVPFEEILARFKEVHGDRYDYLPETYTRVKSNMGIICKIHGRFDQNVGNHLAGANCPVCGRIQTDTKRALAQEDFLSKCNKVHGLKYSYENAVYECYSKPIVITCLTHGDFEQIAGYHLGGAGCSRCAKVLSKPQVELNEFIQSLGIQTIENFKLKDGKHLDVYCPDLGVAFEYNGLIWHSTMYGVGPSYHLHKTEQAKREGIDLIHIFEDEWLLSKDKIKNLIKVKLGVSQDKRDARKLRLDPEVSWGEASELLDKVHVQSTPAATTHRYGLRDKDGKLVSIMLFSDRECAEGEIELTRFCSEGVIRGGFSRLLKFAKTKFPDKDIISFSDRTISQGNVYARAGFVEVGKVPPRYWYIDRGIRRHRRHFQKAQLKERFENYDENLTEEENCRRNNLYRIYDCGKVKWKLFKQ